MTYHRRKHAIAASLADLKRHQEATVDRIELPAELASRLMDLGFVPGTVVAAAQSAPGGDPRVFRIDGAEIALRRETAQHILVRNSVDAA